MSKFGLILSDSLTKSDKTLHFTSNSPKVSVKNWKIIDRITARKQQGLLPNTNSEEKKQEFTNCRTKSELDKYRKKIFCVLNDNSVNFSFKNSQQRLIERERLHNLTPKPGLTYLEIKEERKKNDFQHLIQKFGKQSIGINKELPKFSEFCKEYWKKNQKTSEILKDSFETHKEKQYFKRVFRDQVVEKPTKIKFDAETYKISKKFMKKQSKELERVRSTSPPQLKSNPHKSPSKKVVLTIGLSCPSSKSIRSSGFSPQNLSH